jgi:hypothetical protein
MNFIRNNWRLLLVVLSVNIAVLLVENLLAWRIWISWNGRETFETLNGYIFAWVSIELGSIAIVTSIIASLIASNSLRLTRATTRPFLTYLVKGIEFDEKNKVVLLQIFVSNKGNLPAEKPALQARQYFYQSKPEKSPIDMEEWIQNLPKPGELKKLFKDEDKKSAATYFPAEERNFNFEFGGSSIPDYQKSQRTAIGIAIFYQSMQREYETIRWFLYDKSKALKVQFKPIPEKDHFT